MKIKKSNMAFSLVELMISVVIIGVLASVAIPAYYRYILKAKSAEAPLMVKKIYDLEVVFASRGEMFVDDPTHGQVPCKPSRNFVSLCMGRLNEAGDGVAGYFPGSVKSKVAYYHHKAAPIYNASTKECAISNANGNPRHLGMEEDLESVSSNNALLGISILKDSRYYLTRARRDSTLAAEYGVDLNKTLMIYAIGDLDGDYDVSIDGNIPCQGTDVRDPSDTFDSKTYGIFARGLYIDNEGELKGTPGLIIINPYE